MTFDDILDQVIALLQRQGRVSYGAMERRFELDDTYLEDLKDDILFAYPVVDEDGRGLVWTGDTASAQAVISPPAPTTQPLSAGASPEPGIGDTAAQVRALLGLHAVFFVRANHEAATALTGELLQLGQAIQDPSCSSRRTPLRDNGCYGKGNASWPGRVWNTPCPCIARSGMTAREYMRSVLQLLATSTVVTNQRIEFDEQDVDVAYLKGAVDPASSWVCHLPRPCACWTRRGGAGEHSNGPVARRRPHRESHLMSSSPS